MVALEARRGLGVNCRRRGGESEARVEPSACVASCLHTHWSRQSGAARVRGDALDGLQELTAHGCGGGCPKQGPSVAAAARRRVPRRRQQREHGEEKNSPSSGRARRRHWSGSPTAAHHEFAWRSHALRRSGSADIAPRLSHCVQRRKQAAGRLAGVRCHRRADCRPRTPPTDRHEGQVALSTALAVRIRVYDARARVLKRQPPYNQTDVRHEPPTREAASCLVPRRRRRVTQLF